MSKPKALSKFGNLQTEYARHGYSLAHVTRGENRGSFIVSKQGEITEGWMRYWQRERVEDVEGAIKEYERRRKESLIDNLSETCQSR